ncbi:MAG: hypothetical protein HYZ90_00165 [Candidatus Omnitrophica bacterium]|nr:hypothetical protein [Candidatus Omnitrophota bacterium]
MEKFTSPPRPVLCFLFALCALGLLLAPPAFAIDLKIESASFDQHFNPGELVTFTVKLKNNEASTQFAEVDVTLVNIDTEAETTLTPILAADIAANSTIELTRSYSVEAGTYTVSFPLFDGNGVRVDRIASSFPLHVGTETESLRVFPEAIHLGSLLPGRAMHPTPVTVEWNQYRFNRLRLDVPFSIRIYTDNAARYRGIPGAIRRASPAGLVSRDGRYVIPVKIWDLNYGPDIQESGWDAPLAGPPAVDEDDYWIGPPLLEGGRNLGSAAWVRIPDLLDMTANPISWRRLMGQDPHDSRFVSDTNRTGDFTLRSPFTFYLATDIGPTAVEGTYSAILIVELWSP